MARDAIRASAVGITTSARRIGTLRRGTAARRNAALGARYFAARGPALGLVPYFVLAWTTIPGDVPWRDLVNATAALVMLIPLAYLFGALPAALTGALLGPLRSTFYQWRYCVYAGMVGAAIASVFGLLLIPLEISFPVFEKDPLILIRTHLALFGPAGGFAALLLARQFAAETELPAAPRD